MKDFLTVFSLPRVWRSIRGNTMTTQNVSSVTAQAEDYVAQEQFHQEFVVPPSGSHDGLTLSYADVGCGIDGKSDTANTETPVILFFPGVFASRYIGVWFHKPALKLGVRIIAVDRPGMGSSTNVPIQNRVSIWVETLPKLLAHLNIKHVTIMSHCAGTVYALNTLYRSRDILHPKRPRVVLLAPWVDPSHSRVKIMQAGQFLPNKIFDAWNSVNRFIACNVMPSISSSQAVFSSMSKIEPNPQAEQAAKSWRQANAAQFAREYGEAVEFQEAVQSVTMRRMFSEDTTGSNSEALACLRKAPPGSWGKCEDYAQFVQDLADLERSRARQGLAPERKLQVRAYFATSDIMIGKGGQTYVESCWKGSSPGLFEDALDFEAQTVPGPDHDGLVTSVDILKAIVADITGSEETGVPTQTS